MGTGIRNIGLVLALFAATMGWALPPRAGAQNVVFVLIDALRADRIDGARNSVPLMPYLAGLPAVHFRNATSPAASTLLSMTSLFTSQYVDTHGVFVVGSSLPPGLETMAMYFKQAGYSTIGVQTNGNLTAQKGFGQGFDQYVDLTAGGGADAMETTMQALAAAQFPSQPFFLYVHYLDPHLPYTPPQSYRTLLGYPDPALTPSEQSVVEDFMPYFTDHLNYVMGLEPAPTYPVLSDTGKEAVRTLYDGESRYADDEVGALLNTILANYPNTIVAVLADHGEHLWEHNQLSHTVTVYEPLTHVPLIIMAPGLAPGNVDDLVETVDLLPTLADLAGLPAEPSWQGKSLFAARSPNRPAFSRTKYVDAFSLDLAMVKLGTTKLISNRRTGAVELYDLSTDPGESVNIAQQQPAVARQMLTRLNVHLRQNALLNGADGPVWSEPAGSVQEGMRLKLSAPAGMGHVWFRDGQPLEDNPPHLTGATTPLLYIDSLSSADSGVYECMYSDSGENLNITDPRTVNVLAEGMVPVSGTWGTALLAAAFTLLATLCLRRRTSS